MSMKQARLIKELGEEWKRLRIKYPDEKNPQGYKKLAIGLAIAALAEEYYGVNHWRDIPKREQQ